MKRVVIFAALLALLGRAAFAQFVPQTPLQRGLADALYAASAAGAGQGLYLMPAFRTDQDYKLWLFGSGDGVNWRQITDSTIYSVTGPNATRDPTLILYNGTYYIFFTNKTLATSETTFSIISSLDLVNWSLLTTVDCSGAFGGVTRVWSPEPYVDSSNTVHIIISLGAGTDTDNKQLYETHATNSALTTWSTPVALTGNFPVNVIGGTVIKSGSTYYCYYKNDVTKFIEYATSSSLLGSYTVQGSGDWAGWGSGVEGNPLVQLSDSKWRIYFDKYPLLGIYYSESSDLSSWTAKTLISTPFVVSNPGVMRAKDFATTRQVAGLGYSTPWIQSGGFVGLGATPGKLVDITGTANSDVHVRLTNASTGNAAIATFNAEESSTQYMRMLYVGSGFSTAGILIAASGLLVARGGGGLVLATQDTGPIIFAPNSTEQFRITSGGSFVGATGSTIGFGASGVPDTMFSRPAAATIQHGAADADTNALIVAQTIRAQGLLAGGTSNQAGKDWTIIASPGKGTGAGGKIIIQASNAGNTGTVVNPSNTIATFSDKGTAGASAPDVTFAGTITPSQTAGIVGTTTNNNANALSVGEFVTGTVAANTTSMTSPSAINVGTNTNITLTAGDWDCSGAINFTPTSTTSITQLRGGISTTTGTLPAQDSYFGFATAANVPTAIVETWVVPTVRLSNSGSTSVFLVAQATFSASTLTTGGTIRCRRIR